MSFYSDLRSLPKTLADLSRKVTTLMSQTSDLATKLTADNLALKAGIDKLVALTAGVPGLIAQAVADAQAAGADPATLTSLTDLSANLEAEQKEIADSLATTTPAAPAAPSA